MKTLNNKLLCALLCLAMLFITACSGDVSSSQTTDIDTASADIMRLEKIVGTVSITNADGASIDPFEGMKLQSGYDISTADDSFAYISLDDSKALKLDEASSSIIENDGKNLLISLTAGSLFFNVTQALADDETMNIQTSNMITGIRGTSGYLTTYEENGDIISKTTLVTGVVEINAIENGVIQEQSITLNAGETAVYNKNNAENKIEIITTDENDVPDYVSSAINDDETLKQEITTNGNFNLDNILDNDDDDIDDLDDDDDNDNDDLDDDNDDDTPAPAPQEQTDDDDDYDYDDNDYDYDDDDDDDSDDDGDDDDGDDD